MEDRGVVVDKYARETLDLVADVDIKDYERNFFPVHLETTLSRKFCEVSDEAEDVGLLCQDCMCHHCNRFCIKDNKKNKPRICLVGFGDEANYGQQDTHGMDLREESGLVKDKKGIVHF